MDRSLELTYRWKVVVNVMVKSAAWVKYLSLSVDIVLVFYII